MGTRFSALLVLAITLWVTGCGNQKVTRVNPVGLPSPSPCNASLNASATTKKASFAVNEDVAITIVPISCPSYLFKIRNASMGTFSGPVDVVKKYASPGSITETFVVEAYDPLNQSTPVATAVAAASFTIQSTDPNAGNALSCTVARVGQPVLTGQPIQIRVTSNKAGATALLNGLPVPIGVDVQLLPGNAGLYLATVNMAQGAEVASCALSEQLPVCTHRVQSTEVAENGTVTLKTRTEIAGLINRLEVDGNNVPLPPPPYNRLDATFTFPFAGQVNLTTEARVISPKGDYGLCGASYNIEYPLDATPLALYNYYFASGSSTGSSKKRIHSGLGRVDGERLSYKLMEYSVDVLVANSKVNRDTSCGENEVVVGRQPGFDGVGEAVEKLVCAKLKPGLEITEQSSVKWDVFYGSFRECPAGTVMTGSDWGGFIINNIRLDCGKIANRDE